MTGYPLSYTQEWFVTMDKGDDGGPFARRFLIVSTLRITGHVDLAVLQGALDDVVTRHELLRTLVVRDADPPYQQVCPPCQVPLEVRDLDDQIPVESRDMVVQKLIAEAEAGTISAREVPLMRALLCRFDDRDSALFLTVHHSVSDGWSLMVILRDLGAFYAARVSGTAPKLPEMRQYREYVEWQRARVTGSEDDGALKYWAEKLHGAREFVMPNDHGHPERYSRPYSLHVFTIDADTMAAAAALANATRGTLFTVLLAAIYVLVNEITGLTDLTVRAITAGRNELAFHNTMGLFLNVLPFRTEIGDCASFREVVMATRDTFIDAMANELPIGALEQTFPDYIKSREDRRMSELLISVPQSQYGEMTVPIADGARQIREVLLEEAESSDIPSGTVFYLNTLPDGALSGAVHYNRDEFDESTAEGWSAALKRILGSVVRDPDQDWRQPVLRAGRTMTHSGAHRVQLPGTSWSVWRDVCVRSAGFPADMVQAICDEPLARSADLADSGLADADDERLGYDKEYQDAVGRLTRAIAGTHADPAFQEALTWQNPGLAQFLRDHDAGPDAPRRSKQRQRELVIASYLQRYCLKNDTIGFFGPVGWASADPGTEGLVVVPGDRLIARRTTYFEVWAVDKVAAEIARQGRALGWLVPRRSQSVFLDGNVLHRPHRKPVILTDEEVQVLRACDGRRTISDVQDSAGAPDARAVLARLAGLGAVRLDLEGPADTWPERLLRDKLELIPDPAARSEALEPLDRIITARDAVTAAHGDPAGLRRALADLAETFEQVTGSPATRRAGENYAGRTLVYHDTVRDVRVELGAAVTRALAAPLGLVLDSARWLVNDITDKYRAYFADLVDRESARAGGAPVPLQRLLTLASPNLYDRGRRGVGELATGSIAELQRRWQYVLGPSRSPGRHKVSADAIAARVAECFPSQPVTWSGARQHSPDIMIAAASPGDVERGGFLLVLGEIHLATNTLEGRLWVEQHPDPARLIAADLADRGPNRVVAIQAKDSPNVTSRLSPPSALLRPGQLYWSAATTGSLEPPESDTVLPGAAMTVTHRDGELIVTVMPSGAELDFFEVIADIMVEVVVNAFQPSAPAVHRPRVVIDQFVLSREQWTFQVADSAWAFAKDERERYYLARRWRRDNKLPERVFYRVPVEIKPTAADFSSIVLINLFAKHIRQTQAAGHAEFTVTEMLPDLDQLWLTDREGRRYSSELRIIAYDAQR